MMTKIINIRNESDITIDSKDIKMIIQEYYENFISVNWQLRWNEQISLKTKATKLKEKTDNLNSPISIK